MATITWIGLGQMGNPMAANLIKAGHEVRGLEINPVMAATAATNGVTLYDDAATAVRGSDFVVTMLPNGDLVTDVLTRTGGVFDAADPHTVIIDSSTVDVIQARRLHDEAGRRGVQFLDAPVSGGITGAEAATLTVMVGGDAAAFDTARPILETYGKFVELIGGPGSGQAVKIVNNMILGTCLAATCEGVALAEQLGLDTTALFEVVSRSSGDNWALRHWYPVAGVVENSPSGRDFTPGFTTALLVKDLTLALRAGESTGSALETAGTALRLFGEHLEGGAAQLDCSSLITSLRAATGATRVGAAR
ncbi:NAD(P)-dependent oxidoreductase [Gordonia sp. NPDC003376]